MTVTALCAPPWAPSVPTAGILGSIRLLLGSAAHTNSPSVLSLQLKSFHNELLTQLEQKVELDSRYLSVSDPDGLLLLLPALHRARPCHARRGPQATRRVTHTDRWFFPPVLGCHSPACSLLASWRPVAVCLPLAARWGRAAALQQLRAFSSRTQAALKKYQTEQRSKGDSLDKCQAELKKLRKKSQGSKNPQKYSDKELQVGARAPVPVAPLQPGAAPCRVPAFG